MMLIIGPIEELLSVHSRPEEPWGLWLMSQIETRLSLFAVRHDEAELDVLCETAVSSVCTMVARAISLTIERHVSEILE